MVFALLQNRVPSIFVEISITAVSGGAKITLVEQRWFSTLIESHNNAESTFHFKMFDVIIIGKDLNPSDDIVYMNMTSLWHICNWLRAIDAGWIIQLNGDVTFKVNRRK